ncbi:hypothetical protein [Noviherbaspirillum massiliense]|uniref:hypothetical protein n=1 Tax=Noviherbaspirillum massiliense TaxID=1465823 RepID=UPI0003153480|nr:hypothetical protein [Noviherbaspirillum massiliense]
MSVVLGSYLKTTFACVLVVCLALLGVVLSVRSLPDAAAAVIAALGLIAAFCGAVLACAGLLVLDRYQRGVHGKRDLFLELNRTREPAAIKTAAPRRVSGLRRWLARRLLGHDLVVGDLVEVRSWAEIRATLDEQGCLEQLPFMPEMLAMCGRRAYVFRCAHRLFDYRKSRRMRHMDGAVLLVDAVCSGSAHGGCEASCHTLWKAAWLKRIEPAEAPASPDRPASVPDRAVLQFGTRAPRYACQLTQLHAASRPIGNWSAVNFLRPLISGNVAPAAFIVGWLTHLFNLLQHYRGGVSFPTFEEVMPMDRHSEEIHLQAGDRVTVRSSAQIRATLNDQLIHRGMGFEDDMLKHCGGQYCVQAEVRKLIDIVTGEMRTMKTPAYLLHDVNFSGERQLFNAQYEPLFWRSVWLQKVRSEEEGGNRPAPAAEITVVSPVVVHARAEHAEQPISRAG